MLGFARHSIAAPVAAPTAARVAACRLLWAAIWLAVMLVGIKAYYLGVPALRAFGDIGGYLRSLSAIPYVDALFVAVVWLAARAALALLGARRRAT